MNKIMMILMAVMMSITVSAQQSKVGKRHNDGIKQPPKEQKEKKKNKKKEAKQEIIEAKRLYVYGIAMSPSDSVVYMTDELLLDNAQLVKKTNFLVGREKLSLQLAKHMAQKGEKDRICSVTFAKSIKKLDKMYLKQVRKLQKQGFLVKNVGQGEFRFETVREE